MTNWNDKRLNGRLIQLYQRGITDYGIIADKLSEEFGLDISVKAVDSRLFVLKKEGMLGHWLDNSAVTFLDIETTDFSADIGVMLSWAIKYPGEDKVYSDVVTKKELFEGKMDRRIVESLIEEIKKADALVTYFGTGFDNTFMRTRALILDIPFPAYGSIYHYDVYFTARSKLKLHSKRLDSVAKALGCKHQKTPVDISVWQKARWGDKTALNYIVDHNKGDVYVLEEVYEKLRPFVQVTRKSI